MSDCKLCLADCAFSGKDMKKGTCKGYIPMTNSDRIRSMNDEELAEWMCSLMTAECCDQRCPARDICNLGDNGLVKWMKQPAEEDAWASWRRGWGLLKSCLWLA